jgi:putative Holliday junction resolvase
MSLKKTFLALDVGEKRIGVAIGDNAVRIAMPYDTIETDGSEIGRIAKIAVDEDINTIVVGYPRNQSGEATAQTAYAEAFAEQLKDMASHLEFQDESLTSVLAEQQLKSYGKPYTKGDIDARAAAIILQDYLESH